MDHCPSQDWDRYCADMDGPYPVGQSYEAVSTRPHFCERCYAKITPGQSHVRQDMHDEEGRFCGPMRWHKQGECDDLPDWLLSDEVY